MDEAIVAAARFGYGAGPSVSLAQADARAWVKGQLYRPYRPAAFTGLPDGAAIMTQYEGAQREKRRQAKMLGDDAGDKVKQLQDAQRQVQREAQLKEFGARYQAVLGSNTPFVERLVHFWANHFTVSGVRANVRPIVGAFEREALRPNLAGRFETLLLAAVQHPAMGLYLDNAVSVGPDSRAGERNKRGLNENLGRELLELHTLGVDGGYHEEDVRSLARILTGWSIAGVEDPESGHFKFKPQFHEPGPQTLLGRRYDQDGMAQGLAALNDIARHPATARHIARKLAVHFIADDPPRSAIDRLAQVFQESGGDLRRVYEALVDLPEAWAGFGRKVKTPWDLVVSASIATGIVLPPDQLGSFLDRLGQPIFMAPQPSGWPDDAASWIGPEAMLRRVEWCAAFAGKVDPAQDPEALADAALGGALTPGTKEAIGRAESRPQAVALLLASPEFQRR